MNKEQKAYTTFEAARICHVTHHSIKNWIRQGLIKASRTPGGHYRILEKDLDEFREKYDMFPRDKNAKKYRIMVVDDEPDAINLIENILGKDEYEIIKVTNATEVGLKSLQLSPDLILLDFLMPEINGFEVCRALRSNDMTRFIPIMAVTCLTKDSDIERIFACGADEYLAKPFKVDQLVEKVKELVTKGRPVQK
ncbi:MAG TPA: response regulator [Candidatus Hydrogenedens sp.]|nr:response regulator [Candidatus Hydrogenedens sp.]HOK09630.1 response regulator [Candidatus Hydrogenedens sp.]HOL21068.1 response regulator [Candidatus Hydrogenedens sp.]HPP59552.1 response regulator [Candidatus Hydrogenedens sp.]